MKTLEQLRVEFSDFYQAVKYAHENSERPHRGHGLDHDVTVAMLAVQIAPDEETGQKAWCAAMLHTVDRMIDRTDKTLVVETTRNLAQRLKGHLDAASVEEIVQAAIRHGELNQDDQSLVQQTLMDADRLANLMPAVVIRAGQFLPEIPAFEFEHLDGKRNPKSTYSKPKSVLDDLRGNLSEYLPKLRLPNAQRLGREYAVRLQAFIISVEQSNAELKLAGIML